MNSALQSIKLVCLCSSIPSPSIKSLSFRAIREVLCVDDVLGVPESKFLVNALPMVRVVNSINYPARIFVLELNAPVSISTTKFKNSWLAGGCWLHLWFWSLGFSSSVFCGCRYRGVEEPGGYLVFLIQTRPITGDRQDFVFHLLKYDISNPGPELPPTCQLAVPQRG